MRLSSIFTSIGCLFSQSKQVSGRQARGLAAAGLIVSIAALAFFARQSQTASAQEGAPGIKFVRIAEEPGGAAAIAHHQPTESLLIAGDDRTELLDTQGARQPFSRTGSQQGRLAAVRRDGKGFAAGESFIGTGEPGAIARISPDGGRTRSPWVVLPEETGLVRGLHVDESSGELIAVTTQGGVWRIDAAGIPRRIAAAINARSVAGEPSPVAFESVSVAPGDAAKYGPWAGRILALASGTVYAIDAGGAVERFELGIARGNNILLIPAGENFFGLARESSSKSELIGAAAAGFAEFAGDLLITQAGGEACGCRPALWRVRWNGAEFQKTKLAELDNHEAVWEQVTFSTFGADLLQQQGAIPLVGPFGQPAAADPNDITRQEAFIQAANGVTTVTVSADVNRPLRFLNTIYNNGDAPGIFVISAPTIPAGFSVVASGDGGGSFGSLNGGGSVRTSTPLPPRNGEFNIDIKITVPAGTAVDRDYDLIIQVASATDATKFDRTTDRLRITPAAPTQCTVGPATLPGGTVGTAYSQTITAAGATAPTAFSVSAGALPPGLTLNGATGQLSGMPSTAGTYTFTISATGANGLTCTRAYEVGITPTAPLTLVKTVRDLNGGLVQPGDILEYSLTQTNVSAQPINRTFIAEFIPANVAYIADSVRITAGANQGAKTDRAGDDQVEYFPIMAPGIPNGQINILTGTGATAAQGGTLAPTESNAAVFQVRVNAGLANGLKISNGANCGASNQYPFPGCVGSVESTVIAPTPLVGPFDQPAAVGPTSNNDDFTLRRANLGSSNNLTTRAGQLQFINTLRNVGDAPGRFVISAPTVPAGFNVLVSADSGATFVPVTQTATVITPTDVQPFGVTPADAQRNLDVRVVVPVGLTINTDYDVVIQVCRQDTAMICNRTIDRVRPDPIPPNLALVKAVRDLSGNDLNGKTVTSGQTIEYRLTLTNQSASPIANAFIAEYIPANVSYVAGSSSIVTGPNAGAKTDARGDDQVDYYPAAPPNPNGQINFFVGTGAAAFRGGTLAPNESTTVAFRVTVNNAPNGTVINNGGTWGAADFGVGGESNIVTTMVVVVTTQACAPVVGPFGSPAAMGPTSNNDDFTVRKVNLPVTGGATTIGGQVRFLNTVRNDGTAATRLIIGAPVIPAGFNVSVSVDSGATFVSLNQNGTAITPTPVNPGESRNLDVRIELPIGLMLTTDYDVVIQAACEGSATANNRTIDRVRVVTDPATVPNLALVKAVRDVNGADLAGKTVAPGQTIEYTLTLRNAGMTEVKNTFIAEYLPPNVAYVAGSTRITAGANSGSKTDARGDDQVDYFPTASANGQLNITTGTGATSFTGGALAGGESTTVAFRVTINANAAGGAIIRNGADWGAEDFGIGGKSNIVENMVVICPAITVNPLIGTLLSGTAGTAYSQTFTQSGGAPPITWSVTGGSLPPGLTLNAMTGVLSGTPTTANTYNFTITATDANNCTGRNGYVLTINAQTCTQVITVNPAALPGATVGVAYSQTITQTGGVAPVMFSVSAGALPAGLTLNATTGAISGTPTAATTGAAFTIRATDANGCTGSRDYTLTVGTCTPPAITTQPADRQVCNGTSAFFNVTATGTTLSYQWRKDGVNIPGATGSQFVIVQVTPADVAKYDVVVANACGTVTSTAAQLSITPSPTITTQPASQTRVEGQSVTFTVAATGTGLTYQWRKGGVNIAGATASSFTIPAVKLSDAGNYDVLVNGGCGGVPSSIAVLTVTQCPVITVSPAASALPAGVIGTAYSQSFTSGGGVAPVTLILTGTLPAGLSFNAATGVLSGTPTATGTFAFTVTARDNNGCTGSQAYSLSVGLTPPTGDACRLTICFRSANYFSLNWGASSIPNGAVLIDGVNFGSPLSTADPRVKLALDGRFGALNREYVAAQLNILGASGMGAANIVTAMQSQLRCYGLNFDPVTVAGALPFTTETRIIDLIEYIKTAVRAGISGRDACVLTKLLNGLNGNSSANVCHRSTSKLDFSSCN